MYQDMLSTVWLVVDQDHRTYLGRIFLTSLTVAGSNDASKEFTREEYLKYDLGKQSRPPV